MMKHKCLIFGLALASLAGSVSSCKNDVDVTSTCKKIAQETIIGTTAIRSGSLLNNDLVLNIVQYKFLAGNKATRTVLDCGDKVALNSTTQNLSYTVGDFGSNGVGITLFFTPENAAEAPYSVVYSSNELSEQGTGLQYALTGTDDKLASIKSIDENFNNIRCNYSKDEYWTQKVKYNDTTYYKHVVVVGGRPKVVTDTLITEKERTDTICQKIKHREYYEFFRDESTKANTGHLSHLYQEWNNDKTVVEDTTYTYDFKWGIDGVTSGKKFTVRIISTDPQTVDDWVAAISKFDPAKETIVINGNEFQFVKPE